MKMSLKGIKLTTFDATNTLLKFRVPPWQHYVTVARKYGFGGTEEDVKNRFILSYKVMSKKYPNFGKNSIDWKAWWHQVVKSTFEDQLTVNSDIEYISKQLIDEFKTSKCWCRAEGGDRLINLIRDRGVRIGVISNFDPRLETILQNIGVHKYFDFILTSYEIGYSKPDKRIFEAAIDRCNTVQPHECLHIGDDIEKDYFGARTAGWHALLLTDKKSTESRLASKHVFQNLQDLSFSIEGDKLRL